MIPTPENYFGEFGNSISFRSLEECSLDSPKLDWHATDALEIKSTKGQERHTLLLYLRWLFKHNREGIRTPFTVERAESPDFMVHEAGITYGLEEAKVTTFANERRTDNLFGIPVLVDLPPAQTEWIGSAVEEDWAEMVAIRINEKIKKLRKRYSKSVAEKRRDAWPGCDLLLRDVGAAGPGLELNEAVLILQPLIQKSHSLANFRRVNIVSENWAIFDVLGPEPKKFDDR